MDTFIHDPQATLVYGFDWVDWLADGDSIVASTWAGEAGITIGASEIDGTETRVLISGGTDRRKYLVTNSVVSAAGARDDRSMRIMVWQK